MCLLQSCGYTSSTNACFPLVVTEPCFFIKSPDSGFFSEVLNVPFNRVSRRGTLSCVEGSTDTWNAQPHTHTVRTGTHSHTHTHTLVRTHVHTHTHTHMYVHMYPPHTHIHTHVHTCTHVYTHRRLTQAYRVCSWPRDSIPWCPEPRFSSVDLSLLPCLGQAGPGVIFTWT